MKNQLKLYIQEKRSKVLLRPSPLRKFPWILVRSNRVTYRSPNLPDDPTVKIDELVKVGDEIETFVMRVNDVEGTVMLSKKRLDMAIKTGMILTMLGLKKEPSRGMSLKKIKAALSPL